jgi:TGS domain
MISAALEPDAAPPYLDRLATLPILVRMIQIKLPDGSIKEFSEGATARDVAASIGARLAKDAVAARVSGTIDAAFLRPRYGPGRHAFVSRRQAGIRTNH